MIPQKFGRYEVKRQLGRGGMATVYQAYDPSFDRDVAIKVLPTEFLNDPIYRSRFEREAKIVAAVGHPAIIPVYDFVAKANPPYLIMRYMPGGSLEDKLQKSSLTIDEIGRILTRLAPALDLAHQRGIFHRDIKPGNILFDEYDNAYLADFGIAKLSQATASLTGSAIVGTPTYMSPEQAQGLEIDGRTDVYALGVITYQALTGQIPHQADTPVQMLIKRLTEPVPNILDIRPDLPPRLEIAISKALIREPDKRYMTASEFAKAFAKVAHTITPPPTAPATITLPDNPTPTPPRTPPSFPPFSTPTISDVPEPTERITPPPAPKRAIWPWFLLLLLIGGALGGFIFRDALFPANNNTTPIAARETAATADTVTPTSLIQRSNNAQSTAVVQTVTVQASPTPFASATNRATPTPTPTNTPTATATPTPELTTFNTVNFIGTGSGTPLDFESFGTWGRTDSPNGAFVQSDEEAHDGEFSGKLLYAFTSNEDESIVFLQNNRIDGRPRQLQAWVYGDESGHNLSAWIVDAQGQIWQIPMGQVNHKGWQQMTGLLETSAGLETVEGPDNGRIDYPISLRGLVFDDADDDTIGQGAIYIDELTTGAATVATTNPTATTASSSSGGTNTGNPAATPLPSATPTPEVGAVGRIIYTAGRSILTTDPTWSSPQELGTAVNDSCSTPASTVSGDSYNLYYGNFCGIGGSGAGICTSPNGQWEVITGAIDENDTSIVVRPAGGDTQEFIFQGRVDRNEGIRWSPLSDSFLFVERDTIHRAFPTGSYNQLISPAFQPIISQDGSLILYRKPIGPGVNDIFVANIDGSNQTNVTNISTIDKSCAAWRN